MVLVTALPVFDSEGRVTRWFGTNTDITDRLHSEEALRQSEAKLKLSIAIAGLALAEVDYRTDTVQLSPEAAVIYGLGEQACQIAHEEIFEFLHPDERDDVIQRYKNARLPSSGGLMEIEHRIVRADKSVRWINLRKQVFFKADASGVQVPDTGLWAILDISQRKRVEADLESARRLAESANRAKSNFLANMSHEIRSPMAAIIGYADLIETTNDREREKVETIRRNGQFLLALINDILDLSKIEAGKLDIDKISFSPISLVEEVCSLMNVRAAESHLDLRYEFVGPMPSSIDSDPIRLRQILINLVGNAIKFTERGRVILRTQFLADEESIRFDVIDTGIGMSPGQIERLFQPFEQGDSSIGRVYGGSGLGLAISQRLAAMLGGEIRVESRLGQGSTFSMTIAARRSTTEDAEFDWKLIEPPQHRVPKASGSESGSDGATRMNIRAVIVDDRRDIRFLTQHFIEKLGGQVLAAENGEQALDLIQREQSANRPVDVVLMDVQMPKMDGITATKLLRARGFSKPIFALTANAMDSDRQACLNSGFTDYLSKPIDSSELLRMLRRYCSPDSAHAAKSPLKHSTHG